MFFANLVSAAASWIMEHWLLTIVYILVAFHPTRRFWIEFIVKSRWYQSVLYYLVYQWHYRPRIFRWIGSTIAVTLAILGMLLISPGVPIFFPILRRLDRKRREEQDRHDREVDQQRLIAQNRENSLRAEARKQWLVDNPPKLYYNTVANITAVVWPADYEATRKETERQRIDEIWLHDDLLSPIHRTFVFVTRSGRELVERNMGSQNSSLYKIAGQLSGLQFDIAKKGVVLEHKPDIFVPWINESVRSFNEQRQDFMDCHYKGTYYHLVEMQTPKELHPLE